MTRLLVSVRDAEEAAIAVAAGAHLIDVKEPRRGALGAADMRTIAEVVEAVAQRVPVSAALGELIEGETTSASRGEGLPRGVNFAKLGLAGALTLADWRTCWRQRLARLPSTVQTVAVAYADWRAAGAPPPETVLSVGLELGCVALLVDTFQKSQGALFDFASPGELGQLIELAQRANLLCVLAGSLTAETLPRAVALGPHFVAVRGAACAGQRESTLCEKRLRHLVSLVKTPGNTAVLGESPSVPQFQKRFA